MPSRNISLLVALAGVLGFAVGMFWTTRELPEGYPLTSTLPSMKRETATGHYLAARFAEHSSDPAKALEHIRNLIKQEPGNPLLRSDAYRLSLYVGDIGQAIEDIGGMKEADPRMPPPALITALRLAKEGQFDASKKSLRELPGGGLNAVVMPLLELWLEAGAGQLGDKPVSANDVAGKVNDKFSPLVDYHLALVNDQLGYPEVAEKYYLKVVKDTEKMPLRATEALMNFYLRQGRREEAEKLLAEIKADETGAETLLPMMESKELPKPLVSTAQEGIAELLYGISGIFLRIGMPEDALIHLHLTLYMHPGFEAAQALRAHVWEELEHVPEALAAFRSVPQSSLFYYDAQVRANYLLSKHGGENEAIAGLETLSEKWPEKYEADLTLGDIYRHQDKYEDAIDAYSRAIERLGELKRSHWRILYSRGIAYERSKQWAKAEADFIRALDLEPGQADVQNYLGYSWLVMGRNIERAQRMIEEALHAEPDNAHIIDSMGWALYLLGQFDKSLPFLEQAVELMSDDATVNEHLGDVYWRLGRKQEARFQWEKSLAFKPEPEAEANIRKKLAEGLPPFVPPAEKIASEGTSPDHN